MMTCRSLSESICLCLALTTVSSVLLSVFGEFIFVSKGNYKGHFFMRQPHHRSAEVWHALSGITRCYLPPTRLSTNGMNRVFAFLAEAGPQFSDPGWIEG